MQKTKGLNKISKQNLLLRKYKVKEGALQEDPEADGEIESLK